MLIAGEALEIINYSIAAGEDTGGKSLEIAEPSRCFLRRFAALFLCLFPFIWAVHSCEPRNTLSHTWYTGKTKKKRGKDLP